MEKDYYILDEVKALVNAKPEYLPDSFWQAASQRIREVLMEIDALEKSLDDACFEAVRNRQWNRASVIVNYLDMNPGLIAPLLCWRSEEEFLACAWEWMSHVEELLGIPHHYLAP